MPSGGAFAGRAQVRAERFAGAAELGVEDGRLQDRCDQVVSGEGFECAADRRRVHAVLGEGGDEEAAQDVLCPVDVLGTRERPPSHG
ncbi:hypothetical protein [Streptomyces sp. TRM49041]|uniref:hypothetical protein n=1 Tax=Streptomyces sp. TRM49041 TaxID=2603216 RepID=UPI0011ED0F81|nr:hypothetical protein [Streptomyces sp. TRM49041]